MARGKATRKEIRQLIVKWVQKGKSFRTRGQEFNLPKFTVADIVTKYGKTASMEVAGKSTVRRPKVTPRMHRALVTICKSGRKDTVRNLTVKWNEVTNAHLSR
uniref:Uncharacterized protein n=1 Tax=Photinus pyralis TaxID=7054 RepID=A0A1Y1N3R5_PHOPY